MSNKTPWMVALAIFLTGAVVGALVMAVFRFTPPSWPFKPPERMDMQTAIMEHMSRELGLSAEQREHITPLIKDMIENARLARQPSLAAEEAVFEATQAKIRLQLNPEQIRKHDALVARLREHRRAMPLLPDGPPPPGGPPPDGFPPLFGGPPGPPPGGPPPP